MKHTLLLAAFLAMFSSTLSAQVMRYTFDTNYKIGAAEWISNTGASGQKSQKGSQEINSLDLRMHGLENTNVNLATAPGVGGRGRALDLSCNKPGKIPAALAGQNTTASGEYKAITITGWLNIQSPLEKDTTLIRSFATGGAPGGGGFWVVANGPKNLIFIIGNGAVNARASVMHAALADMGKWIFFAVTWDGAGGVAHWYFGTEADATGAPVRVALPASKDITLTAVKQMGLGRSSSKSTGFCGLMDDICVYDTALTADAIEEIRASANN